MAHTQTAAAHDAIAVALIHDKAQALRQQVQWLEELEHDLQAATQTDVQPLAPVNQVNLRQVVQDILQQAGGRLRRREIIERVRLQHPHVAPIGVVSTLATRALFRKVDGDAFELKGKKRQPHSQDVDTPANAVPQTQSED